MDYFLHSILTLDITFWQREGRVGIKVQKRTHTHTFSKRLKKQIQIVAGRLGASRKNLLFNKDC